MNEFEQMVAVDGREYPVVPNGEATRAGVATEIYQDPLTRTKLEGVAVIRTVVKTDGGMLSVKVEFVDDPGMLYRRQIWRGEALDSEPQD
jgi:hypothetical protein